MRAAATAWRNGLAGLLAALVGFSLIKGRSDLNQLARPWAAGVGVLLLMALFAGAIGALSVLRASNGRPAVMAVRDLLPGSIADHLEALDSARALRRGIGLTLACASLLVAAVAFTWYGPERDAPKLQIISSNITACGSVSRIGSGAIALHTEAGEITISLNDVRSMRPVATCKTN